VKNATKKKPASKRPANDDQPLIDDIRLLGRILGDVIREQEGEATYDLVEKIRTLSVAFRRDADHSAERALKNLLKGLSAAETVRVIRSFLLEANVPNVVNVSSSSTARFQVVIRMVDKVGTFANVLNVIKRHGINVEEVANTIFEGGGASCAKLRVVSRPNEACLAEIHAFEEVLHVDMVPLPNLA
jgi:phosphoenolpyruvate carboxylase